MQASHPKEVGVIEEQIFKEGENEGKGTETPMLCFTGNDYLF